MQYDQLASSEVVARTIENLTSHGISAEVVETGAEAKQRVLSLIPEQSEVMTMTSVTLETIGLSDELNTEKFNSVKNKLATMNRETQNTQMQQLGAAPEWAIGSVHAVTEDGQVLIASNTGSQLPAYAYGAQHVIWVVSTQKIVKNFEEGQQRIEQYIVPLESVRARKAYGLPDTWNTQVSKLLIVNQEVTPNRVHLIFVNEKLGF